MIHGAVCVAMAVRQRACGGHSSTLPVVCHTLPSISTSPSPLPPHFLSSLLFCDSITPHSFSLSLSRTNMRSHHRFSSLLALISLTHRLSSSSSSCSSISLLVDPHFLSLPSFSFIPHAHFCCPPATFCCGALTSTPSLFTQIHLKYNVHTKHT